MLGMCKLCGAPAIEQARGKLSLGDKGYVPVSKPGQETSNHPANATDTRIVCENPEFEIRDGEHVFACVNSTGWNKSDFADYTRFLWNRDHAVNT